MTAEAFVDTLAGDLLHAVRGAIDRARLRQIIAALDGADATGLAWAEQVELLREGARLVERLADLEEHRP